MNEAAYEIFDFLPISTSKAESQYVDHLRDAFLALDGADNSGQAFSVMPFHFFLCWAFILRKE